MTHIFNMPQSPNADDVGHMVQRLRNLWDASPLPPSLTKSAVANDLARCGFASWLITEHVDDVMKQIGATEGLA